jgi:hypothetical protein
MPLIWIFCRLCTFLLLSLVVISSLNWEVKADYNDISSNPLKTFDVKFQSDITELSGKLREFEEKHVEKISAAKNTIHEISGKVEMLKIVLAFFVFISVVMLGTVGFLTKKLLLKKRNKSK